jgi:hypothetical protein|tara:strand:+ start:139 stop:441 length:303 start_codon:yes stop_codon:yes gene_type:complete
MGNNSGSSWIINPARAIFGEKLGTILSPEAITANVLAPNNVPLAKFLDPAGSDTRQKAADDKAFAARVAARDAALDRTPRGGAEIKTGPNKNRRKTKLGN